MSAEVSRYTDPAINGHQYGGRPLSEAEKAKAKEEILRDLKPMLAEFAQLNAELNQRQSELEAKKAKLDARDSQLDARKAENDEGIKKDSVTIFYRIFHGSKSEVPIDKIDAIFKKYMTDNPIVVVTVADASGKHNVVKLTSMTGVVQYLKDNPTLKQIDFRLFKAEISDIPTLTAYLAANNCSIKALAMKECLAVADKENLKSAAAARNGALKIQYFA